MLQPSFLLRLCLVLLLGSAGSLWAGQVSPGTADTLSPAVTAPRITTDRWPNNYDAESWAQSVWKLEKAQSDEEKAIAVYKWVRMQLHWGDQCYDGTRGAQMVECDAIKKINFFQYGFCVDHGVTTAALAHAGGMKALEAHLPGHTELEVAYKDKDGVERAHRFDPFWGIVVYDKTGTHIATWEEMKSDASVAAKPAKTLEPWGDKTSDRERFVVMGATKPDTRVRPSVYSMDKSLVPGERYVLGWDALPNVKFINNHPDPHYKDNQDCWGFIRFIYAGGKPENLKYGHELLRPYLTVEGDKLMVKPVHGRLDLTPVLAKNFADSCAAPAQNIAAGSGAEPKLHPEKVGAPATLVYALRTPFPIADSAFKATFRIAKGDSAKVSIAYADWKEVGYTIAQSAPATPKWKQVWEAKGEGAQTMDLKEADLALRGEYIVLVKIELQAAGDAKKTGLDALVLSAGLQMNPMALPRLMPGKNAITLTGGAIKPGYQLQASYAWDDTKGKGHTDVKRTDKFPFTYEILAAGEKADDVRTNSVTLEAVSKEALQTTQR